VKLTTLDKEGAVTVPAGAVEKDGDKRFVHLMADGKKERREVEAGETSGGRTEILTGLAEGEKVLESAPKQK
jgi:multidrug efflux pump subunit AcrA (membrane-fusion protein)